MMAAVMRMVKLPPLNATLIRGWAHIGHDLPKVEEYVEQVEEHIGNLCGHASVSKKVLLVDCGHGRAVLVFDGQFVVFEVLHKANIKRGM